MTVTKATLTNALVDKIGVNQREALDVVELFFEQIIEELSLGNDVRFSGFGTFKTRHKSARFGRNPKTGEAKPISARTVVTFRPSDKLLVSIAQQNKAGL